MSIGRPRHMNWRWTTGLQLTRHAPRIGRSVDPGTSPVSHLMVTQTSIYLATVLAGEVKLSGFHVHPLTCRIPAGKALDPKDPRARSPILSCYMAWDMVYSGEVSAVSRGAWASPPPALTPIDKHIYCKYGRDWPGSAPATWGRPTTSVLSTPGLQQVSSGPGARVPWPTPLYRGWAS